MSAKDSQRPHPQHPPPPAEQKSPSPQNDGKPGGEKQEMKTSPFPTPKMEKIELSDDHRPRKKRD